MQLLADRGPFVFPFKQFIPVFLGFFPRDEFVERGDVEDHAIVDGRGRDAVSPPGVAGPRAWLRPGMVPRGGLAIPAHRLGVILRHAPARVIHHAQAELCHDMALFGRLLEPLESLDAVLWYAFA